MSDSLFSAARSERLKKKLALRIAMLNGAGNFAPLMQLTVDAMLKLANPLLVRTMQSFMLGHAIRTSPV
ncbi:hypothetical protein IAQ61_002624 [Plenodomus lingam]|uniref:uncharacterized protein n=1 Tax=Leptosphaeria maculans TaxID=5022 RepID=UPI00331F93DB|nr:hypothetical protein IAQ61_002624 [Plenodomus lingam]